MQKRSLLSILRAQARRCAEWLCVVKPFAQKAGAARAGFPLKKSFATRGSVRQSGSLTSGQPHFVSLPAPAFRP